MASARGDVDIVRELLKLGSHVCLAKGRETRIPLHSAVAKGRTPIIVKTSFLDLLPLPLDRTNQGLLYFRLCDAAPLVTTWPDSLWITILGGDIYSQLGILSVSEREVSPTDSFIKAGICLASSWSLDSFWFLTGICSIIASPFSGTNTLQ